jgi:hypothetical protein
VPQRQKHGPSPLRIGNCAISRNYRTAGSHTTISWSLRAQLARPAREGNYGASSGYTRRPSKPHVPLRDVLLVLPRIGSVRAARILSPPWIADSKTLDGLTERQRGELINFFRAPSEETVRRRYVGPSRRER